MKEFLSHIPSPIAIHMETLHYGAEEPILLAGEENHHVYFVQKGHAKGYMQTADGATTSVYLFGENSLFGEIEIFCKNMNTIGITAVSRCSISRLHKQHFLQWMKADFDFTCGVICQLAQKLDDNSKVRENLTLLTVKERVLRVVASWHHTNQLPYLTKDQLCTQVSAPMRSINRAIAACAQQGVFTYQKKRFNVLSAVALAQYLSDERHTSETV